MRRLRFSIRTLMIVTLVFALATWAFLVPELTVRRVEKQVLQRDYSFLFLELEGSTQNIRFAGTSRALSELLTFRRRVKIAYEKCIGGGAGGDYYVSQVAFVDVRFNRIEMITLSQQPEIKLPMKIVRYSPDRVPPNQSD